MPICSRCHRYYSQHALWCVHCYDATGRLRSLIQSSAEIPVIGDTYHDEVGSNVITAVSIGPGGLITVTLDDGSMVDIEPGSLRTAEAAPETLPAGMSLACVAQVS